jgi:hypothetical protein
MAYTPASATSFAGSVSLSSMLALTLALSAGDAHADPPPAAKPPPPTFRLEYRLLDAFSKEICPAEAAVRSLLVHLFGYEVIDDHAGPAFAIDITASKAPAHFEASSHILRNDRLPLVTHPEYQPSLTARACYRVVYRSGIMLAASLPEVLDDLVAPPPKSVPVSPEVEQASPDAPHPVTAPASPHPAAAPASPPPPQVTVQLPMPTWKAPEGFTMSLGISASTGLLPTPSFGGLAGVYYRRGAWSGGLEGRFEHGLVSGYLEQLQVDSLYAGAVLVAPCVHEGVFSGCFVTDTGGYSLSLSSEQALLSGRFAMLAFGLRASLEHRVGEHFLLRGFAQLSAIPLGPSIDIPDRMQHLWNTGPAFGTLGVTLISIR